eukprot:6485761-Amphidinium_carterae.1
MEGKEDENCLHLWGCVKSEYRRQNTTSRLSGLTPNSYKNQPFPVLKAKAAQAKSLLPVLAAVAQTVLDVRQDYDALVLKALQSSSHADIVLDSEKGNFVMSAAAVKSFKQSINQMNMIVVELGLRSHPR